MPPQYIPNNRKKARKDARLQKKSNKNDYYKKFGGPQFTGLAARMAQLQEFVNRETNKMEQSNTSKVKKSKGKNTQEAKLKNTARLESLKADQVKENTLIKKYERKIGLLAHHKKNGLLSKEYREDFGKILKDIETGNMDGSYENNSEDNLDHELPTPLNMQKKTTNFQNDKSSDDESVIDDDCESSKNISDSDDESSINIFDSDENESLVNDFDSDDNESSENDFDSDENSSESSCNRGNKRKRLEITEDSDLENTNTGSNCKKKKLKNEPQSHGSQADAKECQEDIYGRLCDHRGNVISNDCFLPPAQRKLAELNNSKDCDQNLLILKNQLNHCLNLLSDGNMKAMTNKMEAIFEKNSRNNVNDAITAALLDRITTAEPFPNRNNMEMALLVAILSANIGCEVGAHILTEFVLRWKEGLDNIQATGSDDDISSHELENLLAFISYLYLFRVVDGGLMFDILNYLSQNLNLLQVKLIIHTLRNVGSSLRKSNALGLKKFITDVQAKIGLCQEDTEAKSQFGFLLEVFRALKNNNFSKIPDYDPRLGDHLKNVMKACLRKGCHQSDLNVTLDDLVRSKVVGRWWIVGSAWSDGLKENNVLDEPKIQKKDIAVAPVQNSVYSKKFLAKAKVLHFTSAPRINIFYALTEGSADRDECVENIIQLKISPIQTKEIFNVMIICCQKGTEYIPLYAYVAGQLCIRDRKYKGCLKLALWDKFKELPALKARYISNLSKLTGDLVCMDAVTMTVFKHLELIDPDPKIVTFLRQALVIILMNPSGLYTVERVFNFLCSSPKLNEIKRGIHVFISKFMPLTQDGDPDKILSARTKLVLDILENTDLVYM